MRRHSPSYSPPRRGYGGRGRSPPRGQYPGRRDDPTSLLVRNIPRDFRAEELRMPFERFGPIKDVYLPKDYYTGEPRGFGFVQFMDPLDAAEAQYHMDHQFIGGREITVVFAEENRKKPEEMRMKGRVRRHPGYGRHGSPYYAHSRSPQYHSSAKRGYHSRSYSPAPRRRHDLSISPSHGRGHDRYSRSPSNSQHRDHCSYVRRSYSPEDSGDEKMTYAGNGPYISVLRSSSPRRDCQTAYVDSRRQLSSSAHHSHRLLSGSHSRSSDISQKEGFKRSHRERSVSISSG